MIIGWPLRLWRSLSAIGLVLGTLFFAAALTRSLVPRSYLIQGLLSGFSFSVGYAIGVLIRSLWRYLELPAPTERLVEPHQARGRAIVRGRCDCLPMEVGRLAGFDPRPDGTSTTGR